MYAITNAHNIATEMAIDKVSSGKNKRLEIIIRRTPPIEIIKIVSRKNFSISLISMCMGHSFL
jgi:hypothetical protein